MAEPDSMLYENRSYILKIIQAFALSFAFTLLGSRLLVRFKITKSPGWDDFFIVIAMMSALIGVGMGDASVHYGLGQHIDSLPDDQISPAIEWDYVQSLPSGLAAMFTKISIFIFLRRLFVTSHTTWPWRVALHTVNAVNILANLASATTVLAQCTPVTKLWNPAVPGSCWSPQDQMAVGIFQGASSAFCDICFATLPIIFLWNVHISTRTKIGICSLMGLGFFTAACAIVRTYVANTENYDDITYNDLIWNIWFDLETICGIVAACLPTVRPLLKGDLIRNYFGKSTPSTSSSSSKSRRYAVRQEHLVPAHELQDFTSSSELSKLPNQWISGGKNDPYTPTAGIKKTTEINVSRYTPSVGYDQEYKGSASFV